MKREIEWAYPTEAGKLLLARESYNARSFPLIDVAAIAAIEAEARAAAIAEVRARVEGAWDVKRRVIDRAAVLAILDDVEAGR